MDRSPCCEDALGFAKPLRFQVATKPFKAGVWGWGATGGWVRLCSLDMTEVGTHPHRPAGPRQGGRENLRDPPNNALVPALDFVTWARHLFKGDGALLPRGSHPALLSMGSERRNPEQWVTKTCPDGTRAEF